MLNFIFLVNKQGQVRLSQYFKHQDENERRDIEPEIVKKCLNRQENQCSFLDYKQYRIIYRKYASLYFIVAADEEDNEMAVYEFIHHFVETLTSYFDKVTEIDIMFNMDKVHMILMEMVLNGEIVETNKNRILAPLRTMDHASKR
ncbi:AP-4 complex subunit sigma-1 [Lingula anatina]|uniref:AP complex subunit sigma n=1 Tax=Lingula anatina TaxID=7574 RepID=A0A1S3JHF5_LINAN|nr:AP-4 complex subunit sigma-1 [Lingula anatina]|eukprot:XP_013409845.1 AP-4 complex subunit sigma-1 [Lingula anatina]